MHRSNRSQVAIVVLILGLSLVPPLHASDELTDLLELSGERVGRFWSELARVVCTEQVSQLRLNPKGEVLQEKDTTYEYLIVMELTGNKLRVEESRSELNVSEKKSQDRSNDPLLVTGGFSTMLLVFHPHFRGSYIFALPDVDESVDGTRRIDFRAVSGQPTPTALRLRGREYPVEWNGSAWLDSTTGMVHRIETDLGSPMRDLGLTRLHAEAEYQETSFSDTEAVFWLPRAASVDAESDRQRWRNVHRFSEYKLFSVEIDVKPGAPR
jgi:hypothetical protein